MIVLRPDQAALKAEIYNEWNRGANVVAAILPTGAGKSVIATDIILDGHNLGMAEAIMAHRNELVGQMSLHVARRGIRHRIIGSKSTIAGIVQEHRDEFGRSFVNPDAKCAVGSVQTIVSRADELKQWAAQIDRFTGDEGHHFLKDNMWGKAAKLFTNARGLLVTACPQRADGKGLGSHHDGIADAMVIGPTMRELINAGSLSDYEIIIPATDFEIDDDAITDKGDFSPNKMREASKRSHIVGDAVAEYRKWVYGKRAICFATDVETATEIANRFNEAGIPAAAVSAKTDDGVRRDMIKRFRDGRLWVLVNVDLFDEGFDVPACEVVIMARPTASLNKYLQMFGRAMRVFAGKPYGIVIDMVSNWKRHGFPDKPHFWTLDRREKRAKKEPDPEDIPLTACRECSRPYERALPACPYCGWSPPLPEPSARTLQQVDGDFMLLDRDTVAQMLQATQLESPASVASRVEHAAGAIAGRGAANRQAEKIQAQQRLRAAIEQWAGIQRHKGRSDSESYRRFYLTTGMDVISALAQSRQDMDRMTDMVRGWCGLEPIEKKTPEQQLIEEAVERGDQGFRGGWIETGAVSRIAGVNSTAITKLLTGMGYQRIGLHQNRINGEQIRLSLYHTDSNADPEDFWVSNGYITDGRKLIEEAIERGDQGFRGGWIEAGAAGQVAGLYGNAITKLLTDMGYQRIGLHQKTINGEKIQVSLYHTDPNADPEDFWVSNGYVTDGRKLIEEAVERGDQGFRGGWIETGAAGRVAGVNGNTITKMLTGMGYQRIGKCKKTIDGEAIRLSLYHTDPNADPADFWVSNGYVST